MSVGGFTRMGPTIVFQPQRRQRGHSAQSGGTYTIAALASRAGMYLMGCAAQLVSLDTVDPMREGGWLRATFEDLGQQVLAVERHVFVNS